MPFCSLNEIFDQSKAQSLKFTNSAYGLGQRKFALSGTLLSLRLLTKNFVMFAPRAFFIFNYCYSDRSILNYFIKPDIREVK
jgi:hypothetical protein